MFARVTAATDTIEALIARTARGAQNQGDYQRQFDKFSTHHASFLAEYLKMLDQINDLQNRQAAYRHYKEKVAALGLHSIDFTPYRCRTLVDHAEVSVGATITFTFQDGSQFSH